MEGWRPGRGLAEWEQTHGKKKATWVLTSTGLLMEGVEARNSPAHEGYGIKSRQMKNSLRLLTLVSSTLCGIFFLGNLINLLFAYNYTHHRFALALVRRSDFTNTLLLGAGFLCSVILYRILVRSMEPISILKDQHRLNPFSSKLRWAVVLLGTAWLFLAHLFVGTGLFGMYAAYLGGIAAGVFLFFPDATFYLGKWISSVRQVRD
jgi:hypothetical protein